MGDFLPLPGLLPAHDETFADSAQIMAQQDRTRLGTHQSRCDRGNLPSRQAHDNDQWDRHVTPFVPDMLS